MYLDFVGDLDELYAACLIGYDMNAPHGMALIAEIKRQDSLIGALQVHNMRLEGLITEALGEMGNGGLCISNNLKGRMAQVAYRPVVIQNDNVIEQDKTPNAELSGG